MFSPSSSSFSFFSSSSLYILQDVSVRFEQRVQSRFSGRIIRNWRVADFTTAFTHVFRQCLICLPNALRTYAERSVIPISEKKERDGESTTDMEMKKEEDDDDDDGILIQPQTEEEKAEATGILSSHNSLSTPSSKHDPQTHTPNSQFTSALRSVQKAMNSPFARQTLLQVMEANCKCVRCMRMKENSETVTHSTSISLPSASSSSSTDVTSSSIQTDSRKSFVTGKRLGETDIEPSLLHAAQIVLNDVLEYNNSVLVCFFLSLSILLLISLSLSLCLFLCLYLYSVSLP